ncbi:MAG: iron ABC transporter permease [Acidimicrobiia bacterium]
MDRDRSLIARSPFGRIGTAALVVVPTLFLAYFFLYPVIAITVRGLTPQGVFNPDVILDVLSDPTLQGVATFTLYQAVLSTFLTVITGLPAAWVFARFDFPGKSLLRAATLVPFVLPTLVVGTAFLALIGPKGATGVDLTGTLWIILIAHVFYNYAIVVRGVGAYWERIDPSLEDAARSLGASKLQVFRTVTLPLLRPAIASTSALVFLFSFTSFGVVLLLGDIRHSTIEVEIWRQTTAYLRLDVASTLAVLQLIGVGVILMMYGRYQQRTTIQFTHGATRPPRPGSRSERLAVGGVLTAMGMLLGLPLGILIGRSFINPDGGIGIANYTNLFSLPSQSAAFIDPSEAIVNSLGFALAASVIALFIAVLASAALSYSRRRIARTFDVLVMLPLGTSAVTIGFGFLVALDWPVDIRTSVILIPIAHALVAIPFVVRTTSPSMGSVQHRLREAAATLGASPAKAWWTIDLRLVSRSIAVGAAFAFAISMGEFGATSFISRPDSPTIPIAIFRLLGRPGSTPFGAALALSVMLMFITGVAVFAIDSLRKPSAGEL